MQISEFILQHVLTTVLTLLAGLLLGGGIGFGIASLLKLLYKAVPGLRMPLMLLPWRTGLFTFILILSTNFGPYLFHAGMNSAVSRIFPGSAFVLIMLGFTIETALATWFPVGLAVRLTSLARTLAVACGVFIAFSGAFQNWGLLHYARLYMASRFQLTGFWTALGIVMGLGLVFDLVLGALQMLLAYVEKKRLAPKDSDAKEPAG